MKHLYESDKNEILGRIDAVSNTINGRLLPTFNSIEEEARVAGEKELEALSANFNPEFIDEGSVYEQAYDEEIYYFYLHDEMRKEFLNSSITWLFHLFEKDCSDVFNTNDVNAKKSELSALLMSTETNSNWDLCNTELRLIANVIKHGKGRSLDDLKRRRPDLIKSFHGHLSDAEVEITVDDLNSYISSMKAFWSEFFNKTL